MTSDTYVGERWDFSMLQIMSDLSLETFNDLKIPQTQKDKQWLFVIYIGKIVSYKNAFAGPW